MPLRAVMLDDLIIDDEASLSTVAIYPRLKAVLRDAGQRFYVPEGNETASWDRTVFLNLTYWGGPDSGDVLCDRNIPADVVAHVAWHHLAAAAVAGDDGPASPSARAMLFGESIASAFDLFLLGHLLEKAPQSDFVVSQAPIMAEAAENAGVSAHDFGLLLGALSRDPGRAFEDMRRLLLDVSTALLAAPNAPAAQLVLEGHAAHPFACLLHHYQLSNWILYARAYAASGAHGSGSPRTAATDAKVDALDAALRAAPSSLSWLQEHWLPNK